MNLEYLSILTIQLPWKFLILIFYIFAIFGSPDTHNFLSNCLFQNYHAATQEVKPVFRWESRSTDSKLNFINDFTPVFIAVQFFSLNFLICFLYNVFFFADPVNYPTQFFVLINFFVVVVALFMAVYSTNWNTFMH